MSPAERLSGAQSALIFSIDPASDKPLLLTASAECRHWSGRAVRWSSCAILLSFLDSVQWDLTKHAAAIALIQRTLADIEYPKPIQPDTFDALVRKRMAEDAKFRRAMYRAGDKHLSRELKERRPPEFNGEKEWVEWLNLIGFRVPGVLVVREPGYRRKKPLVALLSAIFLHSWPGGQSCT